MEINTTKTESRIAFLDGLRGVAILLVILFHAYARWPELLPFGNTFAKFPVFAYGWLGVQLFFIISGFVIFMTLERCLNFQEFILRRWLRLFPAMLACSVIIFVTAPLLPERPAGAVFYYDLIPGLTFINPTLWAKLLGLDIRGIEGAFWSLYVEVKFYIIFGVLYFSVGWRNALLALIGLFSISAMIAVLRETAPGINMFFFSQMMGFVSAQYYGWFAAGVLYYKYFREKSKTFLVSAIAIALISALLQGDLNWQSKLSGVVVSWIFTFAITSTRVQALLTHPGLLFIGFISYPLYLVHENMMVAMIIKIGHQMPSIYGILIPVIPIGVVVGVGWVVTFYIEPRIRKQILLSYKRFCTIIGATPRVKSSPSD